eukprot:11223467-Lingulodinium_polyedra.AAC.1
MAFANRPLFPAQNGSILQEERGHFRGGRRHAQRGPVARGERRAAAIRGPFLPGAGCGLPV